MTVAGLRQAKNSVCKASVFPQFTLYLSDDSLTKERMHLALGIRLIHTKYPTSTRQPY